MTKIALIIGSAPDAVRAREIEQRHLSAIVAINNAWRIRDDWSYLVHAGDFPTEALPRPKAGQEIHSAGSYVPANNRYGGIVYAGATMAFTAGYWVLDALRPDIMAFCGCDMVYTKKNGRTHFYGNGRPDPLRPDPTLQHLEAKANRLMIVAAHEGCLCVNLSENRESRLTFPRLPATDLAGSKRPDLRNRLSELQDRLNRKAVADAFTREAAVDCVVAGGDYWRHGDKIDPKALFDIDRLWLAAAPEAAMVTQG